MRTTQEDLFGAAGLCGALSATTCGNGRPGERCVCNLRADHVGGHVCSKCSMPIVPTPPSGPETDPFTRSESTRQAYITWRFTEDGKRFWDVLVQLALDLAPNGRVSINHIHDEARAVTQIRANNNFRPWLADELIRKYPKLERVIERRKRRKPSPVFGGVA